MDKQMVNDLIEIFDEEYNKRNLQLRSQEGEREMRCKDCYHFDVCMDYTSLKESEFAQNFNQTDCCCEHFVPQLDVVEVVRCKDCKYCRTLKDGGSQCERIDGLLMTKPNDYCSYGERRTTDDQR